MSAFVSRSRPLAKRHLLVKQQSTQLPLPAAIDRLRQMNTNLVNAAEEVIADLELRAKIEDPQNPVLNVSNGPLERLRAAIADAKVHP